MDSAMSLDTSERCAAEIPHTSNVQTEEDLLRHLINSPLQRAELLQLAAAKQEKPTDYINLHHPRLFIPLTILPTITDDLLVDYLKIRLSGTLRHDQ